MRSLLRKLKCITQNCGGLPTSKWADSGTLWMAWECSTCGKIKHAHPTEVCRPSLKPPE